MSLTPTVDLDGPWRPHAASGALAEFADATVLDAADTHVARTLVRLAGAPDDGDLVALGIAFAVRAVRLGSVTVDLSTIATTATIDEGVDVDVDALSWPDPATWQSALRASALVADGDDADDRSPDGQARPLRLVGSRLALDRYWRHERAIVDDLLQRADTPPPAIDDAVLRDGLDRLFPPDPDRADGPDAQRKAAETAVRRSFSVIAGGPGTGKTTTVAAVLALLYEQASSTGTPLRVALAAPTGKAAARLTEAVHAQASRLPVDDDVRTAILGTEASTIHRLLGRSPGSNSRFRHERANQLPHQVVIIDETSMVSLSLMARLVEAVRPSARLVLVGDPQQLTSVEAGAVLGDIVGPAVDPSPPSGPLADGIVVLRTVHRFAGGVGELARSIEAGDGDEVIRLLAEGADGVRWFDRDVAPGAPGDDVDQAVHDAVVGPATDVITSSRRGDAAGALAAMQRVQLLCAHRAGPHGVATWRARIEQWLARDIDGYVPHGWYAGRPLLVTANDYNLGLFNGDTGVVIADGPDRVVSAFERRGEIVHVSPTRLSAVETLYAMTIHKSQGSQFGEIVVVLPDETSPILTRELLYTAVTRAEKGVLLVGTEASIRAAVDRPVSRASGLRERLWG